MSNKNFNWEDLADKLGLSKELMEEMGAEQLTSEQLQMLQTVINLHSSDQQALADLLEETELDNILDDISELEDPVNNKDDLSKIVKQIENIITKKE